MCHKKKLQQKNDYLLENLFTICLSPRRAPSVVLLSLLTSQAALHHFLGKFPLICLYTRDKEGLRVLMRKLSTRRYFPHEPHFEILEKCSVSLFSHTLGCAVRRCSLQCLFRQVRGNRRRHNTFRRSDIQYEGWRRNAKRQENNKEKTLLISAECVSFTCRFKADGPDSICPPPTHPLKKTLPVQY